MVIDKLNFLYKVKIVALGLYLIYLIFCNTRLNIFLPGYVKNDFFIKKNLSIDNCVLIIGGSNVSQGVSAELITENICPALNLGLNTEMGSFHLYMNWLEEIIVDKKYEHVIYSPLLLWSQTSLVNKTSNFIELPGISIFTQIRNYFINDSKAIYNLRGDVIDYACNSIFFPYSIKEIEFTEVNFIISYEINRRVAVLKNITKTDNIYIRVPPIYVETNEQAEVYSNLMKKRIELLKNLGLIIVGTTYVSTDPSLFCDSFHPNAKGRELFSKEIRIL